MVNEYIDDCEFDEFVSRVIYRALSCSNLSKLYFKVSEYEELTPQNCSNYSVACKNFGVMEGDVLYLIYDATSFGTCKKGVIIAQSGIYFSGKRVKHYFWPDFLEIGLGERFATLYVGDDSVGGTPNVKDLYLVLSELQTNMARLFG